MPVEVVDETAAGADALCAAAFAVAEALLDCLARTDDEICVALVDDERIRELNRDWRGMDKATDVLSFSQVEGDEFPSGLVDAGSDGDGLEAVPVLLGDVVISVDTLRRQAADGGWTEAEELTRLLLHGTMHLLGHDHECEDEAREMRTEEERLVGLLAVRGIACAWEDDVS